MKNDILKELHLETRDEAVRFLKSLWAEEPQPCPCRDSRSDVKEMRPTAGKCLENRAFAGSVRQLEGGQVSTEREGKLRKSAAVTLVSLSWAKM